MRKKMFALTAALLLSIFSSAGSALAWFIISSKVSSSNNIGGEFISSYFHSGDGTLEHPFEITKPFHYENLVKLHYEHESFATKEYYFRFGSMDEKMPSGTLSPAFYLTDSNGRVDTTNTSNILNLGGKELPPLGTAERPFIGHIDGSGLTISNFTVAGAGYYDIGIFGYVNSNSDSNNVSPIQNCYWKNFNIDTNKASNLVHHHEDGQHVHFDEGNDCEVGYLAGHTVYAANFSDCYVNDCTINGFGTNSPINITYGYFGMCEHDKLGGNTGRGSSYSFDLDSEKIYKATENAYQSIKNNPIRTRDGYTEYTTPINAGVDPEIYEKDGEYLASHPLSDAITQSNRTYTINGSIRNNTAERNYSYSTIGYQPVKTSTEQLEYETYYTHGGSNNLLPEVFTLRTDWNNKQMDVTTKDNVNTIKDSGNFVYYNGTNWKYIHSENSSGSLSEQKEFTLNLSINNEYTLTGFGGLSSKPKLLSADVYFYVDGVQIGHQNILSTTKVETTNAWTRLHFYNISLTQSSYKVNLSRGLHYFCYFLAVKADTNQGHYSYLCNSGNNIDITTGGRLTATAGTFTVGQDLYDLPDGQRIISNVFTATQSGRAKNSTSENPIELYSIDNRKPSESDVPARVSPNSYQETIHGTNLKTGQSSALSSSSLKFRKDTGTYTDYDPETGEPIEIPWYKWIAYNTPQIEVDYDKNAVFLSDDPSIRPDPEKQIQGYEWQNIDIVGGGVDLYYRNFPLLGLEIRSIALPAESSTRNACKTVPSGDIGKKFYATKYCPGSIVLYFENTSNAADDANHVLGNISFEYINASFLGTSFIDISTPSFKKGSGNFVDLDRFGTKTGGTLDIRTTFNCEVNENGAKACSYCAIDKDRNILGIFDSSGNPSTGFVDDKGNVLIDKLMQIDTYVIALGTNSVFNVTSWITHVNFNYVSTVGYGGSFGKIEFRDSPDTVEDTIFNFAVNIAENTTYSIKVEFVKETTTVGDVTYNSTYYLTVSSDATLKFNVYIYDSSAIFKFNGTIYTSSQIDLPYTP